MPTEERNKTQPQGQPIDETWGDRESNGGWNRLFGVGTAVIAGLAAVLFHPENALAINRQNSPCCNLARNNVCSYFIWPSWYWCPGGYNKTHWTCQAPGTRRLVICGECSAGRSCFSGPWARSIWYYN